MIVTDRIFFFLIVMGDLILVFDWLLIYVRQNMINNFYLLNVAGIF